MSCARLVSLAGVSSHGATELDGSVILMFGLKPCIGSVESGPGLMDGKKEVLNMFTMQIIMVTNHRHMKGINRVIKSTC